MRAALLYSGGVDSSLAALALERFCAVTCLTGTFGVTADHEHAGDAAAALGLDHETVSLDRAVAAEAVETMAADGYPRNGIQAVHEHALEVVAAGDWDVVADGTRRDDRVPTVDRASARSLEDRHGVAYVAPLEGYGRGAVDALADEWLAVERGPSAAIERGDYEAELRALLASAHGAEAVDAVFPDHVQSRVTGRARDRPGGAPSPASGDRSEP